MDAMNKSRANKINLGNRFKQLLAIFATLAVFILFPIAFFYRNELGSSFGINDSCIGFCLCEAMFLLFYTFFTLLIWNKIFPLINRRYSLHIGNMVIQNNDKAMEVHYSDMGYEFSLSDIRQAFQYVADKHPEKSIRVASWMLGKPRIKQGLIRELVKLGYSHYEDVKPLMVEVPFKKAAIVIGCLMSFKFKAIPEILNTPFESVIFARAKLKPDTVEAESKAIAIGILFGSISGLLALIFPSGAGIFTITALIFTLFYLLLKRNFDFITSNNVRIFLYSIFSVFLVFIANKFDSKLKEDICVLEINGHEHYKIGSTYIPLSILEKSVQDSLRNNKKCK